MQKYDQGRRDQYSCAKGMDVAVRCRGTKASLDIEVNGCRITVDSNTDPELLKNVCRMLRTM